MLDSFPREFWLECCNHLSALTVEDVHYERPYDEQQGGMAFGPTRRPMDVTLEIVLGEMSNDSLDYIRCV